MFSVRGVRLRYFALLMAIIAFAAGIYMTFFEGRGFLKTQATIIAIEESATSTANDEDYDVTVRYTVDGKEYTGLLDTYSGTYAVGKTVTIRYNPANPTEIHGGRGFGIYAMVVGVLIAAVVISTWIWENRSQRELEENRGSELVFPPSVPGPERELYFLTDLGTPKYGHRIENRNRRVLYEAKMTKFTLLAPFGFDFIDHEHGTTTPHLVGHQESTEWNSLILDDHHTISFDGEPIWKLLKRNGITVESSFTATSRLAVCYRILRDGQEIAVAESTSQYVHEEDEAEHSKLVTSVPAMGFYRIRTTETDLGLLFLTLLAFARTEATDAQGGSRKALINTIKGS